MLSALGALRKQVQYHEAKNTSLKENNHELMQKNLSDPHNNSSKKLGLLTKTVLTFLLRFSLKVDQCLAFWLARETSQLCTEGDGSTRDWHNGSEQPQQHAIQAEAHAFVAPLLSLLVSSRGMHYTSFHFSQTTLLAAIKNTDLSTEQWVVILPTKAAKQDVVTILSSTSVLLKVVRQSVSDILSTRNRIPCSTLLPALYYNRLLCLRIPVTPTDFGQKRSKREWAEANLVKQDSSDVYDFSW